MAEHSDLQLDFTSKTNKGCRRYYRDSSLVYSPIENGANEQSSRVSKNSHSSLLNCSKSQRIIALRLRYPYFRSGPCFKTRLQGQREKSLSRSMNSSISMRPHKGQRERATMRRSEWMWRRFIGARSTRRLSLAAM